MKDDFYHKIKITNLEILQKFHIEPKTDFQTETTIFSKKTRSTLIELE